MVPNNSSMRLKDNLKVLLELRGYRASQISRLSGVPSQRLSDWLSGASVRNIEQLKKVCEVLGVSLDAILFSEITNISQKSGLPANDPSDEQVFMVKIKRVKE